MQSSHFAILNWKIVWRSNILLEETNDRNRFENRIDYVTMQNMALLDPWVSNTEVYIYRIRNIAVELCDLAELENGLQRHAQVGWIIFTLYSDNSPSSITP
jgi:hypothetical protein